MAAPKVVKSLALTSCPCSPNWRAKESPGVQGRKTVHAHKRQGWLFSLQCVRAGIAHGGKWHHAFKRCKPQTENGYSSWGSFEKDLKSMDSHTENRTETERHMVLKDQSVTVLWFELWIWHFQLGWLFNHADWLSSAINQWYSSQRHHLHGWLLWLHVIMMK